MKPQVRIKVTNRSLRRSDFEYQLFKQYNTIFGLSYEDEGSEHCRLEKSTILHSLSICSAMIATSVYYYQTPNNEFHC